LTPEALTPELTAMLDRSKVSDRKAVLIVVEMAKSLGHDIHDTALNRTSTRCLRQNHRSMISTHLREEFHSQHPTRYTLGWKVAPHP
jgi:hypothetical protein